MYSLVLDNLRNARISLPCGQPTGDRTHTTQGTQIAFLMAATGKALTTVFAGCALTATTFPNISLLPAFVAGFTRVLINTMPGTMSFPVFLTCEAATSARAPNILEQSDFLAPVASATA